MTCDERVEVHARRPREQQRLGERGRVGRAERVVDQLQHLALAELADVHDHLAHRLEDRLRAGEVLGGAAGHDRERARLGARRGAR